MSNVQELRQQTTYAVGENVPGVVAYPGGSAPPILCTGMVSMQQDAVKEESPEIVSGSRGVIDVCIGKSNPGSWSCSFLDRHNGKGAVPVGSAFINSVLGDLDLVGSTSAEYTPKLEKGTFTLHTLNGTLMRAAVGATVSSYEITTDKSCHSVINVSGQFMKLVYADRSALTAAVSSATLAVDAREYTAGALVCVRSQSTGEIIDDNSGNGFKVLSVNLTADTITLEAQPSGGAIGDYVDGFLPSHDVQGTVMNTRGTTVTLNTVATALKSISFTIADADDFLEDELTASGYPEGFVAGKKVVTATMALIARKGDAKYITEMLQNTDIVIVIVMTTGSLSKTTTLNRCTINSVSVSGDDPKVTVDLSFSCLETSGNDSISIKYH